MTVLHKEVCSSSSEAESRDGFASWDHGKKVHFSIKYTWFDKRGMHVGAEKFLLRRCLRW